MWRGKHCNASYKNTKMRMAVAMMDAHDERGTLAVACKLQESCDAYMKTYHPQTQISNSEKNQVTERVAAHRRAACSRQQTESPGDGSTVVQAPSKSHTRMSQHRVTLRTHEMYVCTGAWCLQAHGFLTANFVELGRRFRLM